MDKVYMHIRVSRELRDKLIKQAKEKNITLNAYLNILLGKR